VFLGTGAIFQAQADSRVYLLPSKKGDGYYHEILKRIHERKICLISNQAAGGGYLLRPSKKGNLTYFHDLLYSTGEKELFKVFTPEHGLTSQSEDHGLDNEGRLQRKLPIETIYRKTADEMVRLFNGCEAVLFDLPDAGVRPYTYRTILMRAVEASAKGGGRFVLYLVDKPNPAAFFGVRPPMIQSDFFSYLGEQEISFFPFYTYAELSRYYVETHRLSAHIRYFTMTDYYPKYYRITDSMMPPSPALPDVRSLECYWIGIFVESTTLDFGRFSKDPFCVIGFPGMDYSKAPPDLKGIEWNPYTYKPFDGNYKNRLIKGYRIEIADIRKIDPVHSGYEILRYLIHSYPDFEILGKWGDRYKLDVLTGSDLMRKALEQNLPYRKWYRTQRKRLRLYKKGIENSRLYR